MEATAPRKRLSTGAIVAIVLGAVALVGAIITVVVVVLLAGSVYDEQQAAANDSVARADVATLGRDIATYFVDSSEIPSLTADGVNYYLDDAPLFAVSEG